jgi:tetratricopeptide (TPR) repeat protein
MNTAAFLQGELERLFELESMMELSREWLGVSPQDIGNTDAKGAFARALVNHCAQTDALVALADAMRLSGHAPASPTASDGESVPATGSSVGGIRLVEYLGRGSLGRVFLGERTDAESGVTEQVAVKVFDSAVTRDRAAVQRSLPHARALAQVASRGLANVIEAGLTDDGRLFVVSEYVRGRTLGQELKQVGKLGFAKLRTVARDWLAGLSALHAKGLVHGHLTPSSAFIAEVDEDGDLEGSLAELLTVRLLEGAAGPSPRVLRVAGEPRTLAPEVARGAAPDARSDIYAMGCLLYEAITGRPPFGADDPVTQVAQHLLVEPVPPSKVVTDGSVSPAIDAIVLRALRKRPEERYESAKDFADALEALGRSMLPAAPADALSAEALREAVARFESDPEDEAAAEEMEALVAGSRIWQPVVDTYAEQAGLALDPALKKRLWFRAARVLSHELRDREAAEAAYERILALDPEDAQARGALEGLYRRGGRHEQLTAVLLDRLETETDAETRAQVLREVGDLYETHLYQPDNALVAYAQALAEDATDSRTEDTVHRLARAENNFEDVANILREAAESTDRPENALAAHMALARVQREGLDQLNEAHETLTRALTLDPAYEPALTALTHMYRETSAYPSLVQLLLHCADAASNAARARTLRVEAAGILVDNLGDAQHAEKLLATVFAADPSHEGVALKLEALYRARGDTAQAVAVLERSARGQESSQRASTLMRLAALHEESDDGADRALESYRAALAIDDKNKTAIDGLLRLLSEREDYAAMLPLLEQKLALTHAESEQVEILDTLGTLQETLGDRTAAVRSLERAVAITPGHPDACDALARLYRSASRHEDLADLFDLRAKATEDVSRKVDLLMQSARTWMVDVGSPERALFVCERVLAIAPEHSEALSLTARMRSLAGDNASAVEALELLAASEPDPQKKASAMVRAGELHEQREDLDAAIDCYRSALDLDRLQTRAVEALRRIYERRGDLRGEAELLKHAADYAVPESERVRRLVELGTFYLERLSDRGLAEEAYATAAELDPQSLEAFVGLGRLAYARGDGERAIEVLEPLMDQLQALPSKSARDACVCLGDVYRDAGQQTLAERAFLRAKSISPSDRDVLSRLADVALDGGAYAEAAHTLGELLDRHGPQLEPDVRAEALFKLGVSHRALGELGKATVALVQASDLRPDDEATLSLLGDLYETQGNYGELLKLLDQRIVASADDEVRYAVLVKRGDIEATQLNDREAAAKSYVAALGLSDGDRNVLAKLMTVYSEGEEWSKLCDVLVRLAGLVDASEVKAKYLATAGSVAASRLDKPERAADLYSRALEAEPSHASAFRGLCDSLTRSSEWSRLASALRTYAERNAESLSPDERAALWDRVGETCEKRLMRIDEAVQAYEEARKATPDEQSRLERLAQLYGQHPNRYGDRAVALQEELLALNPYRVESYKALRQLYTQLKRPDEAWVVCQALRGLNMAEPEEETFFKRHRVRAPATALECISDELWEDHLLHEDQEPLLTNIFAMLQPAAVLENGRSLESLGLTAQQQIQCDTSDSVMAQMLFYASGVSLVPLPPVFNREGDAGGISFVLSSPPGIGLGPAAFQRTPDQALAFMAGRQLSYFRPGHLMRHLAPSGSALRGWLLSAIRVANPRFPVPESLVHIVEQHQTALAQTLQRPQEQALQSLIERLLREHPEVDTKRWALGVDLTADRLGFVLANSLDAAVAVVRASPADCSFANERERLKALYPYAVSSRYTALRRATGIALG